MIKLIKTIFVVSAIVLSTNSIKAQSLVFNENGEDNAFFLQDIQRLTFENELINLLFNDGTEFIFDMNNISIFSYDENLSINLINEINLHNLKVFPNPVSDMLHINFSVSAIQEYNFHIYSIQGKLLLEEKTEPNQLGLNSIKLPVSDFPKGIYIFTLKTQNSSISKKIIKQ